MQHRSFTTRDVARPGQASLNGKSATLPASRRGFEARCLPQLFPSSKGQDSGLSSRECRFNSGRECHGDVAQASRAFASHANDMGSTPIVSTNFILAVAQRTAHVVRDDETAGSTPAGETIPPVAQRMSETLRTSRSRVRILPGGPIHGAVTQRPECPPVQREAAGSNPASVATTRRVTQLEE